MTSIRLHAAALKTNLRIQVFKALKYMHSAELLHRDIKVNLALMLPFQASRAPANSAFVSITKASERLPRGGAASPLQSGLTAHTA